MWMLWSNLNLHAPLQARHIYTRLGGCIEPTTSVGSSASGDTCAEYLQQSAYRTRDRGTLDIFPLLPSSSCWANRVPASQSSATSACSTSSVLCPCPTRTLPPLSTLRRQLRCVEEQSTSQLSRPMIPAVLSVVAQKVTSIQAPDHRHHWRTEGAPPAPSERVPCS